MLKLWDQACMELETRAYPRKRRNLEENGVKDHRKFWQFDWRSFNVTPLKIGSIACSAQECGSYGAAPGRRHLCHSAAMVPAEIRFENYSDVHPRRVGVVVAEGDSCALTTHMCALFDHDSLTINLLTQLNLTWYLRYCLAGCAD